MSNPDEAVREELRPPSPSLGNNDNLQSFEENESNMVEQGPNHPEQSAVSTASLVAPAVTYGQQESQGNNNISDLDDIDLCRDFVPLFHNLSDSSSIGNTDFEVPVLTNAGDLQGNVEVNANYLPPVEDNTPTIYYDQPPYTGAAITTAPLTNLAAARPTNTEGQQESPPGSGNDSQEETSSQNIYPFVQSK